MQQKRRETERNREQNYIHKTSSVFFLHQGGSLRGRRTKGREGEVECEREARSLGARRERTSSLRAPNDRASRSHPTFRARFQLFPSLPFVRRPRRLGRGGGGTPYNGLYGEAPPERGTFFRLQVYKRVGISQV